MSVTVDETREMQISGDAVEVEGKDIVETDASVKEIKFEKEAQERSH